MLIYLLLIYLLLLQLSLQYNFTSKKVKTKICNQPNTPIAATLVFAIKKEKIAKDILDKNTFATGTSFTSIPTAGIAALISRFLSQKSKNLSNISTAAMSVIQILPAQK